MIHAEAEVGAVSDGGGEVAHQVAFGADVEGVPVPGNGGGPQSEALVMLGREHDVPVVGRAGEREIEWEIDRY